VAALLFVCGAAHAQNAPAAVNARTPNEIIPVSFQNPPVMPPVQEDVLNKFGIQLERPTREHVFRLEPEKALRERIRQEYRHRNERAEFPPDITPSEGLSYAGRAWPAMKTVVVPQYTCYNPLYFEDKNIERYGWEAGVFQPMLSTLHFYKDFALWPYNKGVMHPHECECNTGYYLPGDCAPFLCYVPEFNTKGLAMELAVILGGIAILP
jgi:hypothetical protein